MSDDDYDYNDVSLKYVVYTQFNAQVTMGQSLSVCHKSYHWILHTQCRIFNSNLTFVIEI